MGKIGDALRKAQNMTSSHMFAQVAADMKAKQHMKKMESKKRNEELAQKRKRK